MTDLERQASETILPPDERLNLNGLSDLLGFHLRLAQVAVYRDFAATMVDLDLTQKQAAILHLISANPGVSQVDLAATLGTDRATMMAIVDRLEQRSFLVRRRSISDRRRQELYLTEGGEEMLSRGKAAIAEHEERFTSRFTPQELDVLVDALTRLYQPS